jgi:hypothetical protein
MPEIRIYIKGEKKKPKIFSREIKLRNIIEFYNVKYI